MRPYQYIVEDRTLKAVTTFPSVIAQKKARLAARRRAQRLIAEIMADGNPVAAVQVENPKWIVDSGSSFHILGREDFERLPPSMRKIRKTEVPQALHTAGGAIMARHENPISVPRLGKEINPYVLKASPTVLSLGSLIMDDDCDFHWVHG